jgi:hypothetical protein
MSGIILHIIYAREQTSALYKGGFARKRSIDEKFSSKQARHTHFSINTASSGQKKLPRVISFIFEKK